jgi:dienelactone hydrolase
MWARRGGLPWKCQAAGVIMLVLSLLAGCSAVTATTLSIPPQQIGSARVPPKPLSGDLALPSGQGPFPLVILLHGCGGISSSMWRWQRRLGGWGYAVLVLDSFGPRGVTNVCATADQPKVRPSDRAGDVLSAALFVRTLPQIDSGRIGVVGLSHGGTTAAWVTHPPFATAYPGLVKAAVDYYGPCGNPGQYGGVPLLALAGDDDDWGQPGANCRAFARGLAAGQPLTVHTYPGVVHAFDNPDTQTAVRFGHRMAYDAAAAEDSVERVRGFLDRWLRHASMASR